MTTTEQLRPIIGLKLYYAQLIFNKKKKKGMEAAIKTKNDIILLLLEELCLCMTTTEQLHPIIGLKPYYAQLIFKKKERMEAAIKTKNDITIRRTVFMHDYY